MRSSFEMMILVCLILLVVAFVARGRSRDRWAWSCLLLTLLVAWSVGGGLIPRLLLGRLQTLPPLLHPAWGERNAIVVVGAGAARWPGTDYVVSSSMGYARALEAARLYYDCRKHAEVCRIYASGGDPGGNGISEAEIFRRDFAGLGISEVNVVVESKSRSTFQNAQFTSVLLRAEKIDKVILVSNGCHVRRALLYFKHFGIDADGAPADSLTPSLAPLPLAFNFFLMDLAMHEFAGIWRLEIYNLLGWN